MTATAPTRSSVSRTAGAAHTAPPPPSSPPEQAPGEATSILPTLNDDGSRRWIRPRPSAGRFLTARRWTAWVLIAIFALIPYLSLNGKPLVLLDIAARRFTLLGKTFLPTDTLLLALLMVGVFLAIFFITALFGRVWCGWACPQTVYMEFVFRPLERLFEGTPGRVGRGGFRGSGLAKGLKLAAFVAASAFIAHTFLAYFVGVEQLRRWVFGSPLDHPIGFLVVVTVTALMLVDFGFLREQVCLVACPYGRLQAALLDRHSLIISYDEARGEPRGKVRRKRTAPAPPMPVALTVGATIPTTTAPAPPPLGDCIDCTMCVTTCPTGIDIRNGLQMECIGCAQCIDACDAVMTKIGRSRGLIRYSSQAAMAGHRPRVLRPRVVIYPAILAVLAGLFLLVLSATGGVDVTVLRGLGQPFTLLDDGMVSNPVKVRVVNRSDAPTQMELRVISPEGAVLRVETGDPTLGPGETRTLIGSLLAPRTAFENGRCAATVRASAEEGGAAGRAATREARFIMIGPAGPRSTQ